MKEQMSERAADVTTTTRKLPASYKDLCRTSDAFASSFHRRNICRTFSPLRRRSPDPAVVTMTPCWLCYSYLTAWGLILINGTSLVVACRDGEHPVYTTKGRICCPKCERTYANESCKHEVRECRCVQGFGCASGSCASCQKFPECKEGRIGTREVGSRYEYHCEKCPSGTVLDMESGLCKPGEIPSTRIPTSEGNDSVANISNNNSSWIFICASVVVCVLLLTIVVHLLIRTMKRAKSVQGLAPPPMHINVREDGDAWSCQYPEEERGDGGAPSNKLTPGHEDSMRSNHGRLV